MKNITQKAMKRDIEKAKDMLLSGGLVAIPTETVYGLSGNALDDAAVAKIFAAKGRPSFNPLICHFADVSDMMEYVEVNDLARKAFTLFSPGPISIVLKQKQGDRYGDRQKGRQGDNISFMPSIISSISSLVSAGLSTLAVRIPDNEVTLTLLRELDFPLAAPSANKSNHISPTRATHVMDDFEGEIANGEIFVINGDESVIGIESTIIDLSDPERPRYLRPGFISREEIERALSIRFVDDESGNIAVAMKEEEEEEEEKEEKEEKEEEKKEKKNTASKININAPGQLLKHYSPANYQLLINMDVDSIDPDLPLINFGNKYDEAKHHAKVINLSRDADLSEAASNLFKVMREMEKYCTINKGITNVQVMKIPSQGIGIAINDRLQRAAAK